MCEDATRTRSAYLTPQQTKRLDVIQTQVKVELARNFGDRLAPIMTEVLVQESTTHPDVLAALEGIRDSLPNTPADSGLSSIPVQDIRTVQGKCESTGERKR